MLHRIFIIFIFLSFSQSSYADKASDKAEFNTLYKEFNVLYANSEDMDLVVELAEKLYALAPKAYGKKSSQYTETIYFLAELYDKIGGSKKNDAEELALRHYRNYFRFAKRTKVPVDREYLKKYLAYVECDENVNTYTSKIIFSQTAIKIAHQVGLQPAEIARIETKLALSRAKLNDNRFAKPFLQSAMKKYQKTYGHEHYKVAESILLIAIIDQSNHKPDDAENGIQEARRIFEKQDQKKDHYFQILDFKVRK